MNWISNVVRPKIRSFLRRETPENLWIKCPETGQLVFYKDVEANQFVIPSSNYHMRISAPQRLKAMFDSGEFEDIVLPEVPLDPLKFRDERRYADRLKDARTRSGLQDAVKIGIGRLEGQMVTIAVQDFDFMGGSLGMAAGEAVITGLETAVRRQTPFIMFAASGGARMQEGILSLMQLPRTTVGVQMLREARKPYIVVLTNPTTGGVTASYAMLGDVQIAEPGGGLPARGISLRAWHGRHGGASAQIARNPCRIVPAADPDAGSHWPAAIAGSRACVTPDGATRYTRPLILRRFRVAKTSQGELAVALQVRRTAKGIHEFS
jgi:acetyl-CoA carboxylase carboxyl transferase subunit beta